MQPDYLAASLNSPLFKDIDEGDILHVLQCLDFQIEHYKKNDYVVRLDTPFDGVKILLAGEVAIVKETKSGTRVIVNAFKPGATFGEVLAFCGEKIWTAAAQAMSDSTVMTIHPEKILTMCQRGCRYHQRILVNLVLLVSHKANILSRKVDYLSLKSINGKLSRYLLEQYKLSDNMTFKLPMNRVELADFLNVSRPSMSRELCKMRDRGIIEFYKESVRIIDLKALEALLED
ncbi:Crp/Fnr family transcriptional regulator [Oscillospiraceae bacterium WX1]